MGEKTLTRMDLSDAVFREVGLSRNESAQLVENVLQHMSDALVQGEQVKISSFGTFSVAGQERPYRSQPKNWGRGADPPSAGSDLPAFSPDERARSGRQQGVSQWEKSRDAFRTISEVAEWLDVPTHVLRFWESRFSQIKPVKRAGGRRYYRPSDMRVIGGVKVLLHDQGMTIRAVQKLFREEGVKHVSSHSPDLYDVEDVQEKPEPEVIEAEVIANPAPAAIFTHSAAPIRSRPEPTPVDEPEEEEQSEMFAAPEAATIPPTPNVPDTDPADDAPSRVTGHSIAFHLLGSSASAISAHRADVEEAAKKLAEIRARMA